MHTCPVCGYPALAEPPRSRSGGGSYEICPSCGFEFGVTDDDRGYSYVDWRRRWVDSGMPWASEGIEPPPADWDPSAQLHAAAVLSPRDDEPFHTCPVCGYRQLFHPPWVDDSPSDEICPCCGTHFGYDDFAVDEIARATRHQELRNDWTEAGYPWFSSTTTMPPDWDPRRQLARLS